MEIFHFMMNIVKFELPKNLRKIFSNSILKLAFFYIKSNLMVYLIKSFGKGKKKNMKMLLSLEKTANFFIQFTSFIQAFTPFVTAIKWKEAFESDFGGSLSNNLILLLQHVQLLSVLIWVLRDFFLGVIPRALNSNYTCVQFTATKFVVAKF